ncbi:diguanylate cyclase (GGDEF) domain-containing protein [Persephonella hydrogeniphila]|uniref:diguanylate cyclase n=1 Tax=Persephonella hydrogeniphila TaxID=198703 RepID=A0A285NBN9_9AQUI|nr:diguanylate cyclase [Persephonella hydrogeniphila]SNZ06708.1 diguanylate cyclase (GGDEF) domain-containing protein [Persephonella hydrogeniphila]
MLDKEIDKLINKSKGWYHDLFKNYNIESLKNVIEKELSRKNRIYICFPEKLEELFQEYYFAKSIFRIKVMLIFGIMIYIFFGIADLILFPDIYRQLWGIRAFTLLILSPFIFYLFLSKDHFKVYVAYCFIAVMAGLSIIGMMFVISPFEAQVYYAGIFLVIFFVYTVSGIPFIYSSISSLIIILIYLAVDLYFLRSDSKYLISNLFFLGSANIIGMIGGYILEYYIRKDFLSSLKIYLDKNELEKLTGKLKVLSEYDELTGLANRRKLKEFFERELKRAIRENFPVSVFMIDIDYFKNYNDKYGHLKGDLVLREVGAIIKKHTRRPTDIASRWGGEEFVVVFSNVDGNKASILAGEIHNDILNKNIPHQSSPFKKITVSIGGYSEIPDNTRNIDELINKADKALYEAKIKGRNRIVVYSSQI